MRYFFILFWPILSDFAWSQDERQFRDMVGGRLGRSSMQRKPIDYYFRVRTPTYEMDLNDDGRNESLVFAKHDGEDWLSIRNSLGREIFKYQFSPIGHDSSLIRISKRKLSKDHTVLILYYFEGVTKYLEFQGTGKLYFLSIDKGDLKTMKVSPGIYFWDEHRHFKHHYHQRSNQVTLSDNDGDGIREINVYYRSIIRTFRYRGNGKWQRFKRPWEL